MKTAQSSLLLAFATVAMLGVSEPRDSRPSSEDRKHLASANLTAVKSVAALPAPVKAALAALYHQDKLEMADPDQPFQVGDSIAPGPPLPGRRFVFAACDDELCVIHYERGGISHLYYVVAFGLEKGKDPAFRWGARTDGKLADLPALREALAAGKLHENEVQSW